MGAASWGGSDIWPGGLLHVFLGKCFMQEETLYKLGTLYVSVGQWRPWNFPKGSRWKWVGRKSVWHSLLRLLPPTTRIQISSRKTFKAGSGATTAVSFWMETELSHKRAPCWLQQERDVMSRRLEFLICLTLCGYWWCCVLFHSLTQVHVWRRSQVVTDTVGQPPVSEEVGGHQTELWWMNLCRKQDIMWNKNLKKVKLSFCAALCFKL